MIAELAAARMCRLVDAAFDMAATNPGVLAPPFDPRLIADWALLGHFLGKDCLFGAGPSALGEDVCYGFLARSVANPTQHVAVVRGTGTLLEWLLDAEFFPVAHPVAGRVEVGFWRTYIALRYVPIGLVGGPAAEAVAAVVGPQAVLTVVGHSLGAAIASYLAFDLAELLGGRLSACLLASPRPGDETFGKAFDARLGERYGLWNYELDFVPRVPRGPDYNDLLGVQWIGIESALARIRMSLPCHHHVLSYAAMLGDPLTDWPLLNCIDKNEAACILGPRLKPTATASTPAPQPPP